MSSLLRAYPQPVGKTTNKFDNISTPCYFNTPLDYSVPIPFSYSNTVLDITITNSDVQDFITNGNTPDDESEYQAKFLGGSSLVLSLGPNLITYLRNRITSNESLGSQYSGPVVLYVKPLVTKVQLAQPGNVSGITFENVYGINDQPPSSDEYTGGDSTNDYFATWVFRTPMTVQYVSENSPSGYRYITFSTHYDGN